MYLVWKWFVALFNLGVAVYNMKTIIKQDFDIKREGVFLGLGILSLGLWARSLHQYAYTLGYTAMGVMIFFELLTSTFAFVWFLYFKKIGHI